MSETLLLFSMYLANSIAGGIYALNFLHNRYNKRITLFAWTCLYFIIQNLVLEKLNFNDFIGVLADIVFLVLMQALLYQIDISKQFFVTISFVAGKGLIRYIVVVLINGLNWIWGTVLVFLLNQGLITSTEKAEVWKSVTSVIMWFVIILIYAILIAIYLSIISRKFVKKDYQLRTHEYAFLILPSMATLCIYITLKMMIISVENGMATTVFEKVPATMFWVPLICFLLLGVNISSVILFQKMVRLSEEEQKRVILENQIVQMQREIEEIQDIYADMRGLRHDMRSHLESIAAVIKKTSGKDREELDSYIGGMKKAVSRLDFSYKTGNPITDVIIHQKKQEAEKQHISFEADFSYPDKQQIDVYDIGIMLNNALENAIEASSKLEGQKGIILRSYMKGNLFFIEIENDFSGELVIDSKSGLPTSSKADKQFHGLGMENIQRCAKKYMGDIDITIRDMGDRRRFCLTIMVYEKYFTPKKPYFAP